MKNFEITQKHFQNYLLCDNPEFSHLISDTKKISKKTRLEIYKNAYQLRLQDALSESYSVLKRYLGVKAFDALCIEYIKLYPSTFRSIRWYGDQFPLFLKSHKKYQKSPYLSELAEWEWVSGLAFDAKDADLMTIDMMTAVAPDLWESIQFKMHPSLHRLNLSWNTVEIWEKLSDEKPYKNILKNKESASWIVWRNNLICKYKKLSVDAAYAIDAALAGKTMGDICEGLCEFVHENEAGQRAALLLKEWISSGLIVKQGNHFFNFGVE